MVIDFVVIVPSTFVTNTIKLLPGVIEGYVTVPVIDAAPVAVFSPSSFSYLHTLEKWAILLIVNASAEIRTNHLTLYIAP